MLSWTGKREPHLVELTNRKAVQDYATLMGNRLSRDNALQRDSIPGENDSQILTVPAEFHLKRWRWTQVAQADDECLPKNKKVQYI